MAKRTNKKTLDATIQVVFNSDDVDDDVVEALEEALDELSESIDGLVVRFLIDASDESDDDDEDDDDLDDDDEDDDDLDDEDDEDDDEDEDEDEDLNDDDEAPIYTEDELADLDNADLKELLEYWEVELEGRFSAKKAIAAILDAQGEADKDDEDDEDDEDEDEYEEIDEDALNEMGLAELKALYEEVFEEAPAKGMRKAALIEAILESAEED